MRRLAGALLLLCAGPLAAQEWTMEEAAKREQEALKRARVLRIIGIPGMQPSVAAALEALGAEPGGQDARMVLAADALFEAGKAELRPQAEGKLKLVAHVLRELPAAPLTKDSPLVPASIECHGEDATLAQKRAAAVKDWLVENAAIDPARLSTRGQGGAPDASASRVEIRPGKAPAGKTP